MLEVDVAADGHYELLNVVEGDKLRNVLGYVQYETQDLMDRLRGSIEKSLRSGLLTR